MLEIIAKFRLMHWSTYVAFAVWGAAGFGFTPSVGAFIVHFFIIPPMLGLLVFSAHHEGVSGK